MCAVEAATGRLCTVMHDKIPNPGKTSIDNKLLQVSIQCIVNSIHGCVTFSIKPTDSLDPNVACTFSENVACTSSEYLLIAHNYVFSIRRMEKRSRLP